MADTRDTAEEPRRRSKRDRIDRLRTRLREANERPAELVIVIKGVLDLLADEL